MDWESETVLITGGAGFVGRHLSAALMQRGASVVLVDRHGDPAATRTVVGDVTDFLRMRDLLDSYDVTYVFHLAAQSLVEVALREPVATFEANIRGTWTMLEAARTAARLKAIVIASSDKAYGFHATSPYTEQFPLLGRLPYEASKVCADVLAQCYHASYGLRTGIARCANTYGPGDLNFSRLIPGAIRCGLANDALEIRSNGLARREYLYVEDAVNAYLAFAQALAGGNLNGECLNFGTGETYTVLEVSDMVRRLTGSTAEPRVLNRATGEIPQSWLDSHKARVRLGWMPRVSLEEGLTRSIAWYREVRSAL
jgi:CDP-glucose 4,6-dehydratase